jgi:hypothetical protein
MRSILPQADKVAWQLIKTLYNRMGIYEWNDGLIGVLIHKWKNTGIVVTSEK